MNKKDHIQFITIREDFNEYEVENGQTLRFKPSIVDLSIESKVGSNKGSQLGIKDISHVITNDEIDTSSMELSSAEAVTEKDQVRELKFVPNKQIINIYETQKHLILVAPFISKIFLTNKKDKTNSPILRYTYEMNINVIDKEPLHKRPAEPTERTS
jgi:hypothetical protein